MRFGPFVAEREIGRGATAQVWQARHARTGVPVAVKIVADPSWTGDEVRVAAGLLHPHLTPVYDLGRCEDGRSWVAMELAAGGTVADWRPARWRDVEHVLSAALRGLASLHAARLVHRDVKRANLLRFLDPGDPRVAGWTVKLGDFGIAVGPHDVTPPAGSPETIAPEQIRGERGELGPWTDLYALGIVAHQLVCGGVPFRRRGRDLLAAHLSDPPVFGVPTLPVPAEIFDWIGALLRKDPTTRTQRAADALADLLALGDEHPTAAGAPAPPPAHDLDTFDWDPPTSERVAAPGPGAPRPRPPRAWPEWRDVREEGRSPHRDAGRSLVPHRRWPVVGQEGVRSALWAELRTTITGGSARRVALIGPAGSGKTTLLSWLGARADELGLALPFSIRGAPGEALAQVAGMSARGGRRALERWLSRFGPQPDSLVDELLEGPAGGVEPWFRLAAHVSRHRPVLVLVDDVDESPAGRALATAAAAARTYADGPWMLVAAGRVSPGGTADARLAPEPLADGEAVRVLEHVLPLAPGVADRLWREAGRDLTRALRTLATGCAAGRVHPTPEGHTVASEPDDDGATTAEQALAAVGGDVPLELAPALLGDHAPALLAHDRGGRLVVDLALARRWWGRGPDEARNQAAVAAWRGRGDHRREGLAHAVAGRAGAAAAAWVLEGDDTLQDDDRLGFLDVTGRLSALLPELPDPPPSGVCSLLAHRHRMLGTVHEAARLTAAALDRAEGATDRWRAWGTLGHLRARQGRLAEAVSAWEASASHARETGDPVRRVRSALRALSGTPDVARWEALWAETLADAPSQLAFAAHMRAQAFLLAEPARALGYLADAPAANQPPTYRIAILNLTGSAASRVGDPARAIAAFEASAALARRIGHPQYVVIVVNLAMLHILEGRDGAARDWTELGLTLALRLTPDPFLADALRVGQAVLGARAGEVGAAAALLEHVAPRLTADRWDLDLLLRLLRELERDAVPGASALLRRLSPAAEPREG